MRLEILDHVSFVKDHVIPCLAFKDMGISTRQSVRGDADVEVVLIVPSLAKFLATFCTAMVAQNPKARQELFEFHLPIQENACWHHLDSI